MKRTQYLFTIKDNSLFKKKALAWAQQFEHVVWLDSNNYQQKYSSYQAILAVDDFTSIKTDYLGAFEKLHEYQTSTKDYLFGYLTYDLKNATEQLTSKNYDGLQFADLHFFQPKKIFFFTENNVEVKYLAMVDDEIESDFTEIENFILKKTSKKPSEEKNKLKIKLRIHKDEYYKKVTTLLKHIHKGDIYEANFCQEFYAENTQINPLEVYSHLNKISKPPFACFAKFDTHYLLSASPERYLKKEGQKIISQPIKGTAKRLRDSTADNKLAFDLSRDPKERAENIMIVDLVRNDLSKTATKGSVQVAELCKVYSFEQVHQMISTITSQVALKTPPVAILETTFPMGSMTGAPKISAMQIIEKLEASKRGVYAGSVGYFTPTGDFDFNVVIRSILYNEEKQYVSYSVGGAITAKSIPEKEYEECLLKAKAMKEVLLAIN